jgi:hypothetical protein
VNARPDPHLPLQEFAARSPACYHRYTSIACETFVTGGATPTIVIERRTGLFQLGIVHVRLQRGLADIV